MQIAQGVAGYVADKGSVRRLLPYTMHAVKQGFQVRAAAQVSHRTQMSPLSASGLCTVDLLRLSGVSQSLPTYRALECPLIDFQTVIIDALYDCSIAQAF